MQINEKNKERCKLVAELALPIAYSGGPPLLAVEPTDAPFVSWKTLASATLGSAPSRSGAAKSEEERGRE